MNHQTLSLVTVGPQAAQLSESLEKLRGILTVYRRCEELSEALGLAQAGRADIVLLSQWELDGQPGADRSLLDRLNAAGSALAIVDLTLEEEQAARVDMAGVSSAAQGAELETLLVRIYEAQCLDTTDQLDIKDQPASFSMRRHRAEEADSCNVAGPESEWLESEQSWPLHSAAEPSTKNSTIYAVWGPLGSPGVTTLAINFAAEQLLSGSSVLLIDLNSYSASVAASLGLLDESAGVAQACRLADQGLLDERTLANLCMNVALKGHRLQVLTGLTRSSRWMELRPKAIESVLTNARALADVVVIDTAFCLEPGDDLLLEPSAPKRNGATLKALESADEIVVVGNPDSIGVPRLLGALDALNEVNTSAVRKIIFNKIRASSVGANPEEALNSAWSRYSTAGPLFGFLPYDRVAADAALLAGQSLAECAPRSALRLAIQQLFLNSQTSQGTLYPRRVKANVKFAGKRR